MHGHEVAHDGKAEARAGFRLIQPPPPRQRLRPGFLRQARTIVVDHDLEYGASGLGLRLREAQHSLRRRAEHEDQVMAGKAFDNRFAPRRQEALEQGMVFGKARARGHGREQIEIAKRVDWVYDFALPPLVLHGAHRASPAELGAHSALFAERLARYPDWPELDDLPACEPCPVPADARPAD